MSELARPKPAFVDADPIMAAAFVSFVSWAWAEEEFHTAFAEASGITRPAPAQNAIDAMIDDATGVHRDYAERFVAWLITNHWGEEEED